MEENKATKYPNKPKRPPGAFFLFLEEFRRSWWAEVKGVAVLGRVGGEKWKSMSEAEKTPYEEKATQRKADYLKLMDAYNKKQESSVDEVGEKSEKSQSEVHDQNIEEAG